MRSVGLTLVALALVTLLTQCQSFSGIDPMAADGWEKVKILYLGDHNFSFVSNRDAERDGSIVTASIRTEAATTEPLYLLRKERIQIRSAVARMQFDCTKHASRVLHCTLYQDNNLKGASVTREYEVTGTPRWWYGDAAPPFDLGGFDAPNEREKSAWVIIAKAACARAGPQSASVN